MSNGGPGVYKGEIDTLEKSRAVIFWEGSSVNLSSTSLGYAVIFAMTCLPMRTLQNGARGNV